MGIQTRHLFGAIVLLFTLGSLAQVFGCSCMPERPVCEAFGGASAVFVGRIVGSAERKVYEDRERGEKITYDVGTIYFAVEEAFSGVQGKRRVEIHSGTGGGDCGYWFRRGERYLIYAGSDEKGVLHTNICTRTRPLEDAAEDLTYLRQLPPVGTGARIYGQVGRPPDYRLDKEKQKIEGLAGIKVTVRGAGGQRYELVTDTEGRYELAGLKPGEYEVQAALPDYYVKDDYYAARKLSIYDRGCASADFAAISNGRISGRIMDIEGLPVKKAKLVLLTADAQGTLSMRDEAGMDYVDDQQGRFEIGQVAPGEYVLGMNLTFAPDAESPYPPTYYPGVTERAEATTIKVGLGEHVKDLVLRLPPKLVERTVQGVVVWPDGSPAVGAEVYLADVNHPGYTVTGWEHKTDMQGRFTLPGLNGLTYWVHANAPRYPGKPYNEAGMTHAEPAKVTLTDSVFGLKLVLTSEGAVCKHYERKKDQ